jgi:hypothetical protein
VLRTVFSQTLWAKEVKHFHSGVDINANLGPGASFVNHKERDFISGNVSASATVLLINLFSGAIFPDFGGSPTSTHTFHGGLFLVL